MARNRSTRSAASIFNAVKKRSVIQRGHRNDDTSRGTVNHNAMLKPFAMYDRNQSIVPNRTAPIV